MRVFAARAAWRQMVRLPADGVLDGDAKDATGKIELFEDGVVIQTDEPNATKRTGETTCTPKPGKHYYFAKVTQRNGNLLWSARVWATVAE
jgi:hypothetical protein